MVLPPKPAAEPIAVSTSTALTRAMTPARLEQLAAVKPPPAVASLSEHFSPLSDPREAGLVEHKLLDIITIAVCGVICGADSWVEVEAFGKARQNWLQDFLELPNGIPSHDTFGRVFSR